MTIEQILDCTFPRKFLVKYALACAKDVTHYIKDPEDLKLVLKCQETVSLWLDDKATIDEVIKARYDMCINAAAICAASSAHSAAYHAFYTSTPPPITPLKRQVKAISHYY